jgi:hypothetical protein
VKKTETPRSFTKTELRWVFDLAHLMCSGECSPDEIADAQADVIRIRRALFEFIREKKKR